MKDTHVFKVKGKPFFPLGGQVKNSSAYAREELDTAWKALQYLHANTAEIPVYWEQVEPVEGKFDFSTVDVLLQEARNRNLKLILLWFATWKNGHMKYAPEWVKLDTNRFQRVITRDGEAIPTLSSHCRESWEADRKAFCRLLQHLREKDGEDQTVIAVQIENEPGIVGSDRDYGPGGEKDFQLPVPGELMEKVQATCSSPLHTIWKECGQKQEGNWAECFGEYGGELMTAWSIARYIDGLAKAGKEIYDIPMYVNVWLEGKDYNMPGLDYPSGGAVSRTLDIWKWMAPHIDIIAPDIYKLDHRSYRAACSAYAREDNPLFVPESAHEESNSMNMFYAIADYGAIGYHTFGIEHMVAPDGSLRPEAEGIAGSFQAVAAALPLLLKYRNTGRIHAVVQEEFMSSQLLDLGLYYGLVRFFQVMPHTNRLAPGTSWPDFRHNPADLAKERGRGLVIQVDEHEFYLLGAGFQVRFHKKNPPYHMLTGAQASEFLQRELVDYVRVEEGHFDEEGNWIVHRRRNGDELDFNGAWVQPDVGVVHVLLNPNV